MTKFDIVKALEDAGYTVSHEGTEYSECYIMSKEYSREIEACWYGKQIYTVKVEVMYHVMFNTVMVKYYDGGREPFKTKTHLADKRCFNAIKETLKCKDFEL